MRPTNPLWYLAAFVVALGTVMIGTIVAAGAWDPVREATVIPVTERVDAAHKSLAVYTDVLQPDRQVACHARGLDKRRVEIPSKGIDIAAETEGTKWHLIGLLTTGTDGLKVVCTPKDGRIDNASYGFATVSGYQTTVNNARGIAVLGAAGGVLLAGWVFYCRRERRKESADA